MNNLQYDKLVTMWLLPVLHSHTTVWGGLCVCGCSCMHTLHAYDNALLQASTSMNFLRMQELLVLARNPVYSLLCSIRESRQETRNSALLLLPRTSFPLLPSLSQVPKMVLPWSKCASTLKYACIAGCDKPFVSKRKIKKNSEIVWHQRFILWLHIFYNIFVFD